jgi:hypothetical protein
MSEYYWELVQHDGTRLEIPPSSVDVVKRNILNNRPIATRSSVIPPHQIKYFRKTDKPFNAQPLLEDVARAFNEPMYMKDGSIVARWVKKQVTQNSWNKHYSNIGSYRFLGNEGDMVVVGFQLPVHAIDYSAVELCNTDEVLKCERT